MTQREMFAADRLEVLGQCAWLIHTGHVGQGPAAGLEGKLTACRAGSIVFYVRETVVRDHFVTSSNERMAWKRGEVGRGRQALELCAPAADWRRLAELIARADALGRPVRFNRNFTYDWARRQMAGCPGLLGASQ